MSENELFNSVLVVERTLGADKVIQPSVIALFIILLIWLFIVFVVFRIKIFYSNRVLGVKKVTRINLVDRKQILFNKFTLVLNMIPR